MALTLLLETYCPKTRNPGAKTGGHLILQINFLKIQPPDVLMYPVGLLSSLQRCVFTTEMEAENISYLALHRKSFLTPVLK